MRPGDTQVLNYDPLYSLGRLLVSVPHDKRHNIVLRSDSLHPELGVGAVSCSVAGEAVNAWTGPTVFEELRHLGFPVTFEDGRFVIRVADITYQAKLTPPPVGLPNPKLQPAALARLLDIMTREPAPLGQKMPLTAIQTLSGGYSVYHGVGYMRRSFSGAAARQVFEALWDLGVPAEEHSDGPELRLYGLNVVAMLTAG